MKREDLFAAIGGLDESLLEENVTELPKRRHYAWITAIAACAVLGVGALCLPKLLSGGDTLQPAESVDEFHPLLEMVEEPDISAAQEQLAALDKKSTKMVTLKSVAAPEHEVRLEGFTITWLFEELEKSLLLEPFVMTELPEEALVLTVTGAQDVITEIIFTEDTLALNGTAYHIDPEIGNAIYRNAVQLVGNRKYLRDPEAFSTLTLEEIEQVVVADVKANQTFRLQDAHIRTFLEHLKAVDFVGVRESQELLVGDGLGFDITYTDGTTTSISPSYTYVNGILYDVENIQPLVDFGYRLLASKYADSDFFILPASEEWLNSIYFGSEFPYFVYGDEDHCIFSDGMSGLYAFDFDEGALTFVGNIEDSLDKAGVPHGAEGWNGISFSAIREDGKVEILCTASYQQEDGTLKERGFYVDLENRKLIEIRNFEYRIIDRIDFTYNSPYNGFDFLFGAAPIPLEDGYICFENSGLNNEVLPGEGSHLAMIELRKVKGDVVESWVPFAELAK